MRTSTLRAIARSSTSCILATVLCCAGAASAIDAGYAAKEQRSSARYHAVASLAHEDGTEFYFPLTQGADGLMYGIAHDAAAIFRVETDGTVTVVHTLTDADGRLPLAQLTLAPDGWLYGTTGYGGADDKGTLFKISTTGEFVVLHSFSKHIDQGLTTPQTALVPDGQGGFYACGHLPAHWIKGALFHYSSSGEITILAQFTGPNHGRDPNSLVMGTDGVLYGTTSLGSGGVEKIPSAVFFSYTPDKGLRALHTFDYFTEGQGPTGTLVNGPDGAIYGVMSGGGAAHIGSIYRMSTHGDYSLVHAFTGTDPLGQYPDGGLAIDATGKLYGTTTGGGKLSGGTVYAMTRQGEGHVVQALGEAKWANGYFPVAAPTALPDGTLWGLTQSGGANNWGTVFRVDPAE